MDCLGARFISGSDVRVVRNIRSDGSFAGMEKGDLLVTQGEVGNVRSSGYFLQDQVIYQVFFPESNRVVGIRDTEVIDASLEWVPCLFRSLDMAELRVSLKMHGEIVAVKGELVEVQRVYRDLETGRLEYEISVAGELVRLDARMLQEPTYTEKEEAYG
ncbi:nitrogen fixation protein NifZ [Vibrio sp. JC009]|uniref:nitrogen fixation protein NifZ n=1 Tax=Vibrio sp. JC009 TaxID=2912314 RepID=UPI0023B0DE1D|nr:nitrogen fixation protein NifZ [Vibrio sp. JC009]WED24084.1 nitrogen fixation protein NifZ [Vibrio sp. JC009]